MRTLIVSLNAKFEHENPAPWYLKAACDIRQGACGEVMVLSGTINDQPAHLYARILEARPDVVGISCYIWNRDMALRLFQDLRAVLPAVRLVAGGPEVSHADGADAFLAAGVDVVLAGEGEARFADLLAMYRQETHACVHADAPARPLFAPPTEDGEPDARQHLLWRSPAAPLSPGEIPSPCLPEFLAGIRGRIAYVEASRGCPYRCSYCLSSESPGVTRLPLEQVFSDVDKVVRAGAKVIKFVDRTFNVSEARTLEIWRHLLRYANEPVTFHFEIAPDRISEAQLALLRQAPPGLFQVEAGIQSVHPDTLGHIRRQMDVDLALKRIASIREAGNVHVHADLIVGLPQEGMAEVAVSFDRLSQASPHHLQVGFLKLIRGTQIRREADRWGYVSRTYAPYEVLSSSALSARDMLLMKDFEETVERFRNSGRFLLVMQWMLAGTDSAFSLFLALTERLREQDLLRRAVSSDTLFRFLLHNLDLTAPDAMAHASAVKLLSLDWVCTHRNPFLPDWLAQDEKDEPPETKEVLMAYGEQGDEKTQGHKALHNRYHATALVLPEEVGVGVRRVGGINHAARDNHKVRVLVDVRRVHPVLGRPEVVVLPDLEV